MYDVKQLYTAAKNYALNVSEIEAKVNEATSDDPWGASSTLMQEIAAATNNFQDFNEIMPAIYRNFMEREAREWRQIYKVSRRKARNEFAIKEKLGEVNSSIVLSLHRHYNYWNTSSSMVPNESSMMLDHIWVRLRF